MTQPPQSRGSGGVKAMISGAWHPPADPTTSFTDRNVLITGANSGLGLQASIKFVNLDCRSLVLGVRDHSKGTKAKEQVARSLHPDISSDIHIRRISLDTLAAADQSLNEILAVDNIDIAVLNAGVAMPRFELSPDDFETCVQVNVLSTVYLAIRILNHWTSHPTTHSQPPILELVSSIGYTDCEAAWFCDVGPEKRLLEQCNNSSWFTPRGAYCTSKLLLQMCFLSIVEELGPRHSGSCDPIVVTSCPGMTKTNLGKHFSPMERALGRAFQAFTARTAEQGSRTLVSACAQGEEAHGKMWRNDQFDERAPLIEGKRWEELKAMAWGEVMGELRKFRPGLKVQALCAA